MFARALVANETRQNPCHGHETELRTKQINCTSSAKKKPTTRTKQIKIVNVITKIFIKFDYNLPVSVLSISCNKSTNTCISVSKHVAAEGRGGGGL